MGRQSRILTLAAATMVIAAACGTAGLEGPADSSGMAPPASAELSPGVPSAEALGLESEPVSPLAAPSESASASTVAPDADVLPRSISYAILSWTVTDAAITNLDPVSYVSGTTGPPTAKTSLLVDLDIRNDDVHVSFVSTTVRLVAVLQDGSVVAGKELKRSSLPPVSSVQERYVFSVPAGTGFEGLLLRIEDPGRKPSVDLPLSGPAPEVEANVAIDSHWVKPVPIPGIEMHWTVDRVLIGSDWPLPIGFKGGTLVPRARAESGHRWVGIVARVDVDTCACKGGVLDQTGSARLFVDGRPYTASAAQTSNPILNASTFSDVMLVFDIPGSAEHATLQVGPLEKPGQQATLAFDLGPQS